MNRPLHGDGLLDSFFYYLWIKNPDMKLDEFRIPDTVIYRYSQPRAWYFTSRQGLIKRKSKEKLTAQNIEAEFAKNISDSGIVATYTCINSINGPKVIEYFGLPELRHFLNAHSKMEDGILQKFIDPKGNKNFVIQTVWSPSVLICEMRENLKDLYELKYDMYERAVTYEGEEFHTRMVPMKGKGLKKHLKRVIDKIVEHIGRVSSGSIRITRLVLQFKLDFNENLWLLRAASIRNSEFKKEDPIDLNQTSHMPESVNCHAVSMNSHSALMLQKSVICHNCDMAQVPSNMHEMKYSYIIMTHKSNSIPSLILKYYPKLSSQEFKSQKSNPLFLNNRCLVCENCYLGITRDIQFNLNISDKSASKPKLIPIRNLDPTLINRRREITQIARTIKSSSSFLPIRSKSNDPNLKFRTGFKNSNYESEYDGLTERGSFLPLVKSSTSRDKPDLQETKIETVR
jgi:hypothetical protein